MKATRHYVAYTVLIHTMLPINLSTITATNNTSPATSYRSYLPVIGATCAAAAGIYYVRKAWNTTKTSSLQNGNLANRASGQSNPQEYDLNNDRYIRIIENTMSIETENVYCKYDSEVQQPSLSIVPHIHSYGFSTVINVPKDTNVRCWSLAMQRVNDYNRFTDSRLRNCSTPESSLDTNDLNEVYLHRLAEEQPKMYKGQKPDLKIRNISIPIFGVSLQAEYEPIEHLSHMLYRMLRCLPLSPLKINIYAPHKNTHAILLDLMYKAIPAFEKGKDPDKILTSLLLETDNSLRYRLSGFAFHYYCKYSETLPKISRRIRRFCLWLTPEVFLN